jgi:hypothetical protein
MSRDRGGQPATAISNRVSSTAIARLASTTSASSDKSVLNAVHDAMLVASVPGSAGHRDTAAAAGARHCSTNARVDADNGTMAGPLLHR